MACVSGDEELRLQLEESRAALAGLDGEPPSAELAELRAQLEAWVQETEQELLASAKRALLAQLDLSAAAASVQNTDIVQLQHTDGRIHLARVLEIEESSQATLELLHPRSKHQLEPVQCDASLLLPAASAPVAIRPGLRVLAPLGDGSRLWAAGTILSATNADGTVVVRLQAPAAGGVSVVALPEDAIVADPGESDDASADPAEERSVPSRDPSGSGSSSSDEEDDFERGPAPDAATSPPSGVAPRYGAWEEHTTGVGSRLMQAMGYAGGGLGRRGDGRTQPLAAVVYKEGAGLGLPGAVRADRHVGTAQRRRAAAARRQAAAREAEAERVHRLEQETASQGVFAVLNSAFLRRPAAGASASVPQPPSAGAIAARPPSAGGPAQGPEDARRGLARLAREIDAARARVSSLQGTVRRNQRDPATLGRAQRALADAQLTLRQLEAQLQRASASVRTDAALSRGKYKF